MPQDEAKEKIKDRFIYFVLLSLGIFLALVIIAIFFTGFCEMFSCPMEYNPQYP